MRMGRYVVGAICGIAILGSCWYYVKFSRRPHGVNVLLVTFDTTRALRVGCYGNKDALTPALDELAAQGVLFERAYAAAPLTLPSHATILTGLLPPEHGIRVNGKNGLDAPIPTLAEILSKNGYRTSAFVAAFVLDSKFGLDRGFDLYEDDLSNSPEADHPLHRSRSGEEVVDLALDWLDGGDDKPFFCWVHLYDPHHPYVDHRDKFGDRFSSNPYDAEIAYADAQLGRLLEQLKDRGIENETLVIAVGDHGEGLDDHNERTHSNMIYNSTMHVPLIISQPGRFPGGRREPAVVSLTDLTPTVLSSLNIPHASPGYARSLLPALRDEPLTSGVCYGESEEPFVESGWSPLQCLITEKWKYIRTTRVELYDLDADPGELNNLAASHSEQAQTFETALSELEATFVNRTALRVNLTDEERRVLESLGYAGGGESEESTASTGQLPDVKDMIGYYNQLVEAQDLIHRREFEPAVVVLREIVKGAPEYARAHGLLGMCMAEMGRFDDAEDHYLRVLELGRDVESALLNLGLLARRRNETEEAVKHLGTLLQIYPQSADAHFYLAGIYETRGRETPGVDAMKTAIDHYATVIRLRPDHLQSLASLAWILSTCEFDELRDGERAVRLATQACELTKFQFPPVLDVLAAAYAETGRFDDAVRTLEQCLNFPGVMEDRQFARDVSRRLSYYRDRKAWRAK
ncbi:MAG: sulfatase-like hydrolase/transferase [Planctomycetaceae bacterium]